MHSVKGEKHHYHAEDCAHFCRLDPCTRNKIYISCNDKYKIDGKACHVTNIDTQTFGNDLKMKATVFCTVEVNYIQVYRHNITSILIQI